MIAMERLEMKINLVDKDEADKQAREEQYI